MKRIRPETELFEEIISGFISQGEQNHPQYFDAYGFAVMAADSYINPIQGVYNRFDNAKQYTRFIDYARQRKMEL